MKNRVASDRVRPPAEAWTPRVPGHVPCWSARPKGVGRDPRPHTVLAGDAIAANEVFRESIAHLLHRPVGRAPNHVRHYYASLSSQVGTGNKKRRILAEVEWHSGNIGSRRRRFCLRAALLLLTNNMLHMGNSWWRIVGLEGGFRCANSGNVANSFECSRIENRQKGISDVGSKKKRSAYCVVRRLGVPRRDFRRPGLRSNGQGG